MWACLIFPQSVPFFAENGVIDNKLFTPNFVTLLVCNDIPECDELDNAFSKRLRCLVFPTEFVDNTEKDNQKKIDVNIMNNFNLWKMDIMLLLIDYYKKYTENGLLEPSKNILYWTHEYKIDNDIYLQFLDECVEESKKHVHTTMLYDIFKVWFKNYNSDAKIPNNRNFTIGLKKHKNVSNVKVDNKSSSGIKFMKLKNNILI